MELVPVVGHGHQGCLVSETAGVENGAYLPHHVLPLQLGKPVDYFLLTDLQRLAQLQKRPVGEGEGPLDQIQ